MSYQVLARKWRPQTFADVLGQAHITDALQNMIAAGRIHHGYIFSGIRGIGKTTTARILAKALNCVHGPTPTPCNQCEFCQEITRGYSMDVEEVDGASHRGVDEVRVLQENVSYAPSRSRYKIFIIDEVHMLTTPAFNALLKTLEEPPANVVFVMATTEPWKIPATIHSRAQHFIFKSSTPAQLVDLLRHLAQHEQIEISAHSLALIAKTAGGSVRDAKNLFDQVIGFSGRVVADADVRYVMGIPDRTLIKAFLAAIIFHQPAEMFTLIEQLVGTGANLRYFCMELMERLRNLIVLNIAPTQEQYLVLFDYTAADIARYAEWTTRSELQQWYWLIAQAERDIRFSPHPRFVLEMALTNMANVRPLASLDELSNELRALQAELAASPSAFRYEVAPAETLRAHVPIVSEKTSTDAQFVWEQVKHAAKQPLKGHLNYATPLALTAHELKLGFHKEANASRKILDDPHQQAKLNELLQHVLNRRVRIVTMLHEDAPSLPPPPVAPVMASPEPKPSVAAAPAPAAPPRRAEHENKWRNRGRNTPKIIVDVTAQDIVAAFDGQIVESE